MPLCVKDFTWDETEKMVFISVPLKGVKAHKVDIFTTAEYLKVNFPPYLFECLLYSPIDDQDSKAQVGNGAVVFKLLKKEAGKWGQLQSDMAGDKHEMARKREEAILSAQEKAETDTKKKEEDKRLNQKFATQEIMKTEENERHRIESVKQSEREQATQELERWKEEQREIAEQEKQRLLEERSKVEAAKKEEQRKQLAMEKKAKRRGRKNDIFEEPAGGIPKREVGKIQVSFTHREFPTPERESVKPQEEEWLKKQAEVRRTIEIEDKNLSEEEKNPVWLRDKGNEFFKAGNCEAAVNAYSHAIRLNNKVHSCYSNRAACHLKLRNFFKCIDDCTKALELLVPPVPQNAASRCKCMVRRGTALCQLEMYVEGLKDYEEALKLDPNNGELKSDSEKIRHIIQSETVS